MSLFYTQQHPLACRGVDGLAVIGRTLHDLRGLRFNESEGGNKPADKPEETTDDKPSGGDDGEKKFTQADVDRIVKERLARTSPKPAAPKPKDDPKPAPEGEAPKVLSQEDVDRIVQERLAEKDKELAIERAGDAIDKALEGRRFAATAVRGLDLEQFVVDGKVDAGKVAKWVEDNSTKDDRAPRRDPSQGQRGTGDSASVQSGRDLFNERHKKKTKEQ